MKKILIDVSIIIVNYNTKILTYNAIRTILSKTKDIAYEIIVVDNNSTDRSVEHFRSSFGTQIKVIEAGKNLGFGKANNLGIQDAKGKCLFLLNSDTLLINNAVKILYDYLECNSDVGVCGGNLYDYSMNPIHSFSRDFPSIRLKNEVIRLARNKIYKILFRKRDDFNYSIKPIEVAYITGADMMIKKEVFDECGLFDPDFFMYYEETEISHRIKKRGYKIISNPNAKIVHLEGASYNQITGKNDFSANRYAMATESKYKFFYKIYGVKSVLLLHYRNLVFQTLFSYKLNSDVKKKIIIEEFYKWQNSIKEMNK